jgi:regulator of protease activity HflC (stomatin/prohibitin superfamily)
MFGYQYIKANPTTYVIQYKNGKPVREGSGLSFFYWAHSSSLVAVPMQSADAPFMFTDVSADFQTVSIQGQVTYRVRDPKALATMMNFSLQPKGVGYVSDDPEKLPQRIVNGVQVQVKSVVQKLPLQELLRSIEAVAAAVSEGLLATGSLQGLGVEITDLSILAIKPTPETARALEARVRETILKDADDAIYTRRNSAIEQERGIKENELKTEIAIEEKKRQIREAQMDAERSVLEKRQQIERQEMTGKVELEKQNRDLVELAAENAKRQADAKAYGIETSMKALGDVDPKVLQALTLGSADPATLIALAFQGLAENAEKIGELNISPDLLRQVMSSKKA